VYAAGVELVRGAKVDRYIVDGLIGSGGMARVYRVRHARLGSVHAVKLLQLPTPAVIDRLLREGRAQSSLRHPNIVPVTDVIDVHGAPGLVMEWVGGPNLAALLDGPPLALSEVHAIATGLLAGICAAHDAGWIHRDLKPGNILLQPVGDALVPKITDFGLVKALQPTTSGGHHTRTGAMMGTPAYMAPEQFADAGKVDHRADIYSLGAVLYQVCTGRRPYEDDDTWTLLEAIHGGDPPSVSELRPELPPGIHDVLAKALCTEPGGRTASARELAEAWRSLAWPPPGWTQATLTRAAERVPVATEVPDAATSSETFAPLDSMATTPVPDEDGSPPTGPWIREPDATAPPADQVPAATPTPPSAPAASPSRRALAAAAGGAAVLCLVAVSWWASRPAEAPSPTDQTFTPTSAPRISDDPVVQAHLDQGWYALLQGDMAEAGRRLEAARQGAPDHPAPPLLASYVLLRDGRLRASLDLSEEVVQTWPEADGPLGSLVRVVADQKDTGRIDVPSLDVHLDAYPDDALARLMAADYCANVGVDWCSDRVTSLQAVLPHAPVTWHVIAETWHEVTQPARAREAVRRGLQVSPDDPVLLDHKARDELNREDYDSARQTLDRLRAVDPAGLGHKQLRIKLAALTDDDELLQALRAELTSPSQELRVRTTYYATLAGTLEGLGRAHEAEQALLQARELARAEGTPSDEFTILLELRQVTRRRGDLQGTIDYLEQAGALANASPEIIGRERDRLTAFLLSAQAASAIDAGDLERAEAILARLTDAPGMVDAMTEGLKRSLAVAKQQPDEVEALGRYLIHGECARRVHLGDALLRAGAPDRALPLLQGAPQLCALHDRRRLTAVVGHLALADASDQLGRHGTARRALERVDELWPAPDPDHVLTHRRDRLRRRIDADTTP